MPTYEYRCVKGHEFELFQRMSDEPKATCPECGEPAERLLSAGAGLLFKGDGFYITDYRSEEYKKAAKADGGSGGEGTKRTTNGTGSTGAASSGSDTASSGKEASSSGGSDTKKDAKPAKGSSASSESS